MFKKGKKNMSRHSFDFISTLVQLFSKCWKCILALRASLYASNTSSESQRIILQNLKLVKSLKLQLPDLIKVA